MRTILARLARLAAAMLPDDAAQEQVVLHFWRELETVAWRLENPPGPEESVMAHSSWLLHRTDERGKDLGLFILTHHQELFDSYPGQWPDTQEHLRYVIDRIRQEIAKGYFNDDDTRD